MNGLETVALSFGSMINTFAPGGDAVRLLSAKATVGTVSAMSAARTASFMRYALHRGPAAEMATMRSEVNIGTLRIMRLDQMLVERGLAPSRARAQDLIKRGFVSIDGAACTKPALDVKYDTLLAVAAEAPSYVSRGAEKLVAALDRFGFDASGRVALDVGASTGGFTEVLIARGAVRVYAVDVGTGQLHPRLKNDPRVVSLESFDARALTAVEIPNPVTAIVVDVSFISALKVLGAVLRFAAPGAWLVVLVKPQFEAGRKNIGSGGIVRDEAIRREALAAVRDWIAEQAGWTVVGEMPSPILGGSGNAEFLLGARYNG